MYGDDDNIDICISCKRPKWMCNCLSKYSRANKPKGGLKKRIVKNKKLTTPLKKKS